LVIDLAVGKQNNTKLSQRWKLCSLQHWQHCSIYRC